MGEQARLVRLPDGTEVWARLSAAVLPPGDTEDDGYDDYQDVGALDQAVNRVLHLRELITGVAASVRDAAQRAAPDEVSVEFGVEFAVRGGAIVSVLADAEATSGLKVTLTWRERLAHPVVPGPGSGAAASGSSAQLASDRAQATVPPPAGAGPAR